MAQQGFHAAEAMQGYARQDLFGLQTSMDMLGFPAQQQQQQQQGRESPSTSMAGWRGAAGPSGHGQYYDAAAGFAESSEWVQQQQQPFQPLLAANPLSLSLFDTNPSGASAQGQPQVDGRGGDWFIGQNQQLQGYGELRRSRYLAPAQELLDEFCSVQNSCGDESRKSKKNKSKIKAQWEEVGASSTSPSSWSQSLQSLDMAELQRRKARLLFMLEEVDRRYRRYCEQMRSVVAGFDEVAGEGAATVYAAMAGKAMSRHFRCLRDGIVGQVRAIAKAAEEDFAGVPGGTRGETPRLRILDQCLRQQKLLQQGGLMESHPWRPQRGLPERSVSILRAWLFEHFLHPYPSDVDKHILARQTGLTRGQVSNWFINARVRLWKPMVEEMYLEETKDVQDNHSSATSSTQQDLLIMSPTNPNPNLPRPIGLEDQKPDRDSLSSIVIGATSLEIRSISGAIPDHHQQLVEVDELSSFGGSGGSHRQGFSNNVSLTLGLQQHDGSGRGLSYPPSAIAVAPPSQGSMFYGREPMQFTVLDGDGQNMSLPYRNLMEAQLLHDLAG